MSGISERQIQVLDLLVGALGDLLGVPKPQVDAVRGRMRDDLRRKPPVAPETPGP